MKAEKSFPHFYASMLPLKHLITEITPVVPQSEMNYILQYILSAFISFPILFTQTISLSTLIQQLYSTWVDFTLNTSTSRMQCSSGKNILVKSLSN